MKDIINENIKTIINDYKNLTIKYINYLNDKKLQQLDELFSFSNIKKLIDNELDNIFNDQLLPILKEIAIYNSDDEHISDYDLSNSIIIDINSFINEKINQTQLIINKMKGNEYNINNITWKIPDFSLVYREEILSIKNSFNNFTNVFKNIEYNEFNKIILENLKNNFIIIIENFISSFGKDFFDINIKNNEIQNIKSLFNNIKYSLKQTITSLIKILLAIPSISIPDDLKIKLINLNNTDLLI